jgi:hypothetical protein
MIFFSFFLQRQQTLGNKIETEITNLLEQNPTILRVGLFLEYNDARNRIATHLQRNLDRSKLKYFWYIKTSLGICRVDLSDFIYGLLVLNEMLFQSLI